MRCFRGCSVNIDKGGGTSKKFLLPNEVKSCVSNIKPCQTHLSVIIIVVTKLKSLSAILKHHLPGQNHFAVLREKHGRAWCRETLFWLISLLNHKHFVDKATVGAIKHKEIPLVLALLKHTIPRVSCIDSHLILVVCFDRDCFNYLGPVSVSIESFSPSTRVQLQIHPNNDTCSWSTGCVHFWWGARAAIYQKVVCAVNRTESLFVANLTPVIIQELRQLCGALGEALTRYLVCHEV